MKYYIKILCILMYCATGCWTMHAQPKQYLGGMRSLDGAKVLDSANIRIAYSLVFVADSSKPNEKWNDRKILLIGNSIQHFYSHYARLIDSAATAESKQGTGTSRGLQLPAGVCVERSDIYSNYPSGEQMAVESITHFLMPVYKENLTAFKWDIVGDTTTILGYLCHKAICRYHGRIWEAWFTLDIPLNAGPWKLRGLPGLILKANDDRQHYVFECNGVEQLKNPEPILMYELAYEAVFSAEHKGTREKYLEVQRRFYENYVDFLLSTGCNVRILDDSGKQIEFIETPNTKYSEQNVSYSIGVNARDRYKKIPYNPIELE